MPWRETERQSDHVAVLFFLFFFLYFKKNTIAFGNICTLALSSILCLQYQPCPLQPGCGTIQESSKPLFIG